MASAWIPVATSTGATTPGRNLLFLLEQLRATFDGIQQHFDAMNQQKNGDGSLDVHFVPCVTVYGYQANPNDGVNSANHSAKASYDELNAFITASAASLKQLCAKHRQ
jgi:hypothetical protein